MTVAKTMKSLCFIEKLIILGIIVPYYFSKMVFSTNGHVQHQRRLW